MELVQAENGTHSLDLVTPDDFRSRLERYDRTVGAFRADHNNPGEYVLKAVTCSKDMAGALLETIDACDFLPPIQSVVAAPIITEADGQLVTLGRGYHPHNGGVLITHGDTVPEVGVGDAVGLGVGVGDAVGDGLACETPPPAETRSRLPVRTTTIATAGIAISRALRLTEMRFKNN